MDRPVLIHVGMPKTGTTSLQMNLLIKHPGIQYLGKPLTVFSKDVARLTRSITYDTGLDNPAALEAFRQETVNPLIAGRTEPLVISEEEFSTSTPSSEVSPDAIADRLMALFPQARILITIRRQQDAIPSLYTHMCEMGLVKNIDFNRWFDFNFATEAGQSVYDYAQVTERYANRFGARRVHLVPFEWMRDDPQTFVSTVCSLMSADERAGQEAWANGIVRNARKGTRVVCNKYQQARIALRYRPGNRAISMAHNLNLKGLNYAL
jgi:hypothetical protein